MGLDYAFRRRGPLTMAPSQLGISPARSHRERAQHSSFHVQPLSLDKSAIPCIGFPRSRSALQSAADLARTVRVRSTHADQAPAIAPIICRREDRQVALTPSAPPAADEAAGIGAI